MSEVDLEKARKIAKDVLCIAKRTDLADVRAFVESAVDLLIQLADEVEKLRKRISPSAYIDSLNEEIRHLTNEVECERERTCIMIRESNALSEENTRQREALEFYADEDNYHGLGTRAGDDQPIFQDWGYRARAALTTDEPGTEEKRDG